MASDTAAAKVLVRQPDGLPAIVDAVRHGGHRGNWRACCNVSPGSEAPRGLSCSHR
jgi:hypothetical protein